MMCKDCYRTKGYNRSEVLGYLYEPRCKEGIDQQQVAEALDEVRINRGFVCCEDCRLAIKELRTGIDGFVFVGSFACPYGENREWRSGWYGCKNGVTAKEVEQETARQDARGSHPPIKWSKQTTLSTFLCKKCGEAVQVQTDLLGKGLRFKCFVCHQENHYDLD